MQFVITIERLPCGHRDKYFFALNRGSASIWVVIPVPFHTTIE